MNMSDITTVLSAAGVPVYEGEPSTGASLPYIVVRPFNLDTGDVTLAGDALAWNNEFAVYCCGGSSTASFNLAKLVIQATQGTRVGDSTLSTTLGYVGARVEGNYETQITLQTHQGALA